ncbi:MAG: helix-turn-helix transcriptional regulator [Clostridiales bacterium]|nr:helix-turn-helix transcriptional regulator [Clostridiales bacterium]
MTTNMSKLRGKIVECNTTQEAVADVIGVDRSTFYRKIKSEGLSFTIGEVHKIFSALNLTVDEGIEIFLGQKSQ